MLNNKVIVAVVAGLLVVGGGYIWHLQSRAAAGSMQRPATPVEAVTVRTAALEQAIQAVGSLQSNESVMIRPEITGRVAHIDVAEGSPIEAGKPIVRLDDSIAKAELAEAQASLVLSKANYQRAASLYKKGSGTGRARDEALATMKVDQAQVDLAQAKLDKTVLSAPFAGILGLRHVSVGDYVTPGQDIINLENIQPLKVDFRIPETYLTDLHSGQTIRITVDALPGEAFEGAVYAIDPRIDAAGRSLVIRAQLPNEHMRLRPGLFARVKLVVARQNDALLIPEEALMPKGDKQFVYKVVDGKAKMTQVHTGLHRDGQVQITDGLAAGDVVIVAGQMKVRPDGAVKVLPEPKAETSVPAPEPKQTPEQAKQAKPAAKPLPVPVGKATTPAKPAGE